MEHEIKRIHSSLYPVTLELKYKATYGRTEVSGVGQTALIGSRTLIFQSDHEIRPASRIAVTMLWPVLLDEHVGLQLAIQGRVAEANGERITVSIARYEFLTRGIAPFFWPPAFVLDGLRTSAAVGAPAMHRRTNF